MSKEILECTAGQNMNAWVSLSKEDKEQLIALDNVIETVCNDERTESNV
jgi:hypothetical protein